MNVDAKQPILPVQPMQAPRSTAPSAPAPTQQTGGTGDGRQSLFAGVSLDLSYSRVESLSRSYSEQTPEGYRSVTQRLSRSFESSLSLDFAALGKFENASQRLAQVDPAVFSRWADEADDLFSFSEKDFTEFVDATNTMFDEIEKALGLSSTGLDHVAGFFSRQVKGFLADVKTNKDYMDQNPIGDGEDRGLGIPALMDNRMAGMKEELAAFLEEQAAAFDEQMAATVDESKRSVLASLKALYDQMLARLDERRKAEHDKAKNPVDPNRGDEVEKSRDGDEDGVDSRQTEAPTRSSSWESRIEVSRRVSMMATFAYGQMERSGDTTGASSDEGQTPRLLDIAA
jgi:hypothetical protein